MTTDNVEISRRLAEISNQQTRGPTYVDWKKDVSNGGELKVNPDTAVEIQDIIIPDDTTVYYEIDPDGDGSWPVSEVAMDFDGGGISMGNTLRVLEDPDMRVRLEHGGTSTGAYIVVGVELDE